MSGTFNLPASSRTICANSADRSTDPCRGGIVVRIVTVPFDRHRSTTRRLFGLKGMSHENQETHDVADTAGTLGRVDDSRMLAGGKLKAEKVGIVSDEYATLSDGKLELSFVRRLYQARIGGGGDFYAAES